MIILRIFWIVISLALLLQGQLMKHDFFLALDKLGIIIIRLLLTGFKKAFDLIDHNALMDKFCYPNFPAQVTVWSLDFLHNRLQFAKLDVRVSDIVAINAETSDPNNFKMLINDLIISSGYMN
jgi:hypothetical protein